LYVGTCRYDDDDDDVEDELRARRLNVVLIAVGLLGSGVRGDRTCCEWE